MSTASIVGYMKDSKFRGTYVHYDGDTIGEEITEALLASDTTSNLSAEDIMIPWIEKGITGAGYRSLWDVATFEDEPDEKETQYFKNLADAKENPLYEYIWLYDPVTKAVRDIKSETMSEPYYAK